MTRWTVRNAVGQHFIGWDEIPVFAREPEDAELYACQAEALEVLHRVQVWARGWFQIGGAAERYSCALSVGPVEVADRGDAGSFRHHLTQPVLEGCEHESVKQDQAEADAQGGNSNVNESRANVAETEHASAAPIGLGLRGALGGVAVEQSISFAPAVNGAGVLVSSHSVERSGNADQRSSAKRAIVPRQATAEFACEVLKEHFCHAVRERRLTWAEWLDAARVVGPDEWYPKELRQQWRAWRRECVALAAGLRALCPKGGAR